MQQRTKQGMFLLMVSGRLEIPEAEKIVIELDANKWMKRRISKHGKAFLKSIARRAKEFLMWKLVAVEHLGVFPKEVVWEGEELIASPTHYKITSTEPKGELQVTPETQIVCQIRK